MRQHRFRRWIRNWLNNYDGEGLVKESVSLVPKLDGPDGDKCLQFRVWFANGGKVIQTSRYDRLKDRNFTSMYVITEGQDFGHEIDKIVTMENLRG